ncbi:MAG: endonuclease V [Candidatus Bathyarchaeia archaeon]
MTTNILNRNFSIEKAYKAQLALSKRIDFTDRLPEKISYVAGVDVAYSGEWAVGAVAIMDYSALKIIESKTALCRVTFPYIPTLLSFREIPPAISCIRKIEMQPDVFLVDGHGCAHPRGCGFASHLGVVLGRPTIGVAKGRLIGQIEDYNGEVAYLRHNGKVIGAVLRVNREGRPIYVSVGNMVSLERAVSIVKHCIRCGNIPEPIRAAHKIATEERRRIP